MFHSNTERLIDYWHERRGPTGLPPRTAVNPADFSELLSQILILGRQSTGQYPVRLAGGFVADLHGRDLRQQNGLGLFQPRDRMEIQIALETARRRPEPIVMTVEVRTDGPTLPMEILMAPLAGAQESPERFLCLYQPLGMVSRLMGRPALEMAIQSIRSTRAANEETPRLRLATLDGRRIA